MTDTHTATAPDRLYLVDGSGYIFRAYHSLPPMTRPDGTPVNAVLGFTNMLMKLLADMDAERVAVIFDKGRKTFRNEIHPDYKGHRPDAPEDLIPQFPLIRDAVRAFNVACVEMEGFEADDLIATYAKQAAAQGIAVTVVSSDKDLMQLVRDGVALFDPMKNKPIGPEQVREKFGVGPDKVVDVQALAGDSSDNVPGVPGIGIKTAAQLIDQYGDLETLLDRAEEIKQPKRRQNLLEFADQARMSRDLVLLRDDVDVPEPLETFGVKAPESEALRAFLTENGFKSVLAKVEGDLIAKPDDGAGAAADPVAEATTADADYTLIQDVETLRAWVAEARNVGVVAIDTETDALSAMRGGLVGISLATAPGRAAYIPLAHRSGGEGQLDLGGAGPEAPPQIPLEDAVAELKDLLLNPGVLKVGHNIKYDLHVLARVGLEVAPVDDTMVLSYVLDGTRLGQGTHGLDDLAKRHFDHTMITFKDVCGSGKTQITFDQVTLDRALDYAAEDADYTLRLHRLLKPRLVEERMVAVYETLDRPMVPLLADMERAGIAVDPAVLKDLSKTFAARIGDLEDEVHRLAGHAFNIGSPKQLGEVLFDEMGLQSGRKSSKTGAKSTGADVLEDLAAQGHDLPARVLDWRQFSKLKSTYTDALVEDINPDTGRVHTTFGLTGTSTGRLSSNDPNLQNIPIRTEEGRRIREAFVAAPGHVLLSADYSQIELRLVAHVADIKALKEAFHHGADIHALTASRMFGQPIEGMDPMLRRRAKAINFGIIYGISAFGLARQLSIGRGDAQSFIDAYFKEFPEILDYMERTKAEARQYGFVRTLFGRKCWTPGITDKNPNMKGLAERAAINAPIQGGAADIIKRAMIQVPDALAEAGLAARLLLQVHDELILEVPEAETDATTALVKRVMEGAASLSVPLVVDAGTASTWAAAH
ncbi:DNA polymerase I [Roseospira marina]|uniref:DNA polymerase I n=1 Tax=Roseospira marina TaxID=140057 RepID=A0A5M6IDC5_9PROT|nr:DNA polymerase I [Roseospira marina]KAA5606266.1 DNA polymerase I [Roseospira marina]MBB4314422.1 DNA polymerase-1 [Roseospira marina]MBB5087582.1 DNA polymerase-1 [Roseospira marina]